MKILKRDLRHGRVVVAVESLDDLWHLSRIVEAGDVVSSKTTRKIKATEKEAEKKTLFLEIRVEEADFKDKSLRISGRTTEEKEDVPKGSYHTIGVEVGSSLGVVKESWPKYQLKRLEQASERQAKTIILVLDREEAVFALLKSQGYEVLAELKGKVAKKGVDTVTKNFYAELAGTLSGYVDRFKAETVVVASPAFWKDELVKELKDDELKKKVVLATCSSVGKNAIEEVLKRPELNEVLKMQRAAEESRLVEELMVEIAREGLAAYGRKEVDEAVSSGNVKALLLTDVFIQKNRARSEGLMKGAESVNGAVAIINSENEAGQKLDSLGGVSVLLRYKAY